MTAGGCGGGWMGELSGYGNEAQMASTAGRVSAGRARRLAYYSLRCTPLSCRLVTAEGSSRSL